jgi:hypothetical protein
MREQLEKRGVDVDDYNQEVQEEEEEVPGGEEGGIEEDVDRAIHGGWASIVSDQG